MTLLFVGLLRLELGIEALREELRELKYDWGDDRMPLAEAVQVASPPPTEPCCSCSSVT